MFFFQFFSGLGSFDFSNKEKSCFLLKTLPLTKWLALTLAATLVVILAVILTFT